MESTEQNRNNLINNNTAWAASPKEKEENTMNKRKRQSRLLSLGLCLCMLVSTLPLTGMTYAAETPCPNHQSHTTECGYAKAVEGAPCKHIEAGQHNENCGYSAGIPEVPCNMGCTETGEGGQIIHASDCAYATAVPGTPCKHIEAGQHDENCGYSKAVEGAPCAHTCEKCDGSAESTPKTCVLTEGCTLPAGHDGKCALAMALGGSASTNVIAGDGYRFYPDTGELYAINAAGTTGWRTDTRIHAEETQRYKVVKSVGFQVNAIAIGPEAFRYCSDLTSDTAGQCYEYR